MQTFIPDYRLDPVDEDDFVPICPVCGKECDTVYLDKDDEVVGCDRCISMTDAYDYLYEEEEY